MVISDVDAEMRAICLALPGVTEKLSHGSPAFYAGKQFVMLWMEGHHDRRYPHFWCAAPMGAQEALIRAEPERFFRPPYVGTRGWLGVRLDADLQIDEIAALCHDAYRSVASKKYLALLDDGEQTRSTRPGS